MLSRSGGSKVGGSARLCSGAPHRYRCLFVIATLFMGSFLIVTINTRFEILFINSDIGSLNSHRYEILESEDKYSIKTQGCTIPGLQPFDSSIKKYVKRPSLSACNSDKQPLISSNDTHIWIERKNYALYNVTDNTTFVCCYKSFFRPSYIDITKKWLDDRIQYQECINFNDIIEVKNEFVSVVCVADEDIVYNEFLLFAMKKPLSLNVEEMESTSNKSFYNVIVMGIDAVSRLNFHRTMPKTLAYLMEKGAIELLGYNKVGDNTFPNVVPMLLGLKEDELRTTCMPRKGTHFDNCPFAWEWFRTAGYYTALGEDSGSLGTFNYLKAGFVGNPTDYYLHTFIREAEKMVGNTKDFNSLLCMGQKYFYRVLLDYIRNLLTALQPSKLFGFFWEVTMSHDYLNYPMVIDSSYETFFKELDKANHFDNTILILLSDHGIRWGDIRYTKQGRLEERLPFFYMLLPPSFREDYSLAYSNLKINSRRLTTPFDVHATLLDLANLERVSNAVIEERSKYIPDERSISLFLPIPPTRTCQSAKIEDHWCTCHTGQNLSLTSIEVIEGSLQLVQHLNFLLRGHQQCAKLKATEILEAVEMTVGKPDKGEVSWREFLIVVRTAPGGGLFEATLRQASAAVPDGDRWTLSGSVSRLNLYGEQSRCINDYQLKLYCYCK